MKVQSYSPQSKISHLTKEACYTYTNSEWFLPVTRFHSGFILAKLTQHWNKLNKQTIGDLTKRDIVNEFKGNEMTWVLFRPSCFHTGPDHSPFSYPVDDPRFWQFLVDPRLKSYTALTTIICFQYPAFMGKIRNNNVDLLLLYSIERAKIIFLNFNEQRGCTKRTGSRACLDPPDTEPRDRHWIKHYPE